MPLACTTIMAGRGRMAVKFRNKTTGEICEAEAREDGIYLKANWSDEEKWFKYELDLLAGGWEYYVEPKEPLIDDEDARDAVYSWASKLQIHQVKCKIAIRGLGVVVTTFQACSLHSAPIIEFTSLYANVVHGGFYTISELCGEEGE